MVPTKLKKSAVEKEETQKKRERVNKLIQYHKDLFVKEGVTNPKFIPRLCFPIEGVYCVSFYQRELQGGVDIYTEFCDRQYEPEDEQRRLWKWIYDPAYAEKYAQTEPHQATGDRRYLIPVEELIDVREFHKQREITEQLQKSQEKRQEAKKIDNQLILPLASEPEPSPDPAPVKISELDAPYDNMTIRDYAAIQWKLPVSSKPWLNELIKSILLPNTNGST